MIPFGAVWARWPLTSLTTSGTSGSIRHADELSITVTPAAANLGASTLDDAGAGREEGDVEAASGRRARRPRRRSRCPSTAASCRPTAPRRRSGSRRPGSHAPPAAGASRRRPDRLHQRHLLAWPSKANGVPRRGPMRCASDQATVAISHQWCLLMPSKVSAGGAVAGDAVARVGPHLDVGEAVAAAGRSPDRGAAATPARPPGSRLRLRTSRPPIVGMRNEARTTAARRHHDDVGGGGRPEVEHDRAARAHDAHRLGRERSRASSSVQCWSVM